MDFDRTIFLQLKLLHHASHVTEQLRIFHLWAHFAAVLLLNLYCWLPESTKRTESHSVLVRDVLVKHRVIVGISKRIASQNASRQRQKAYCDGICIEKCSYSLQQKFLSHSVQSRRNGVVSYPKRDQSRTFKMKFLQEKSS